MLGTRWGAFLHLRKTITLLGTAKHAVVVAAATVVGLEMKAKNLVDDRMPSGLATLRQLRSNVPSGVPKAQRVGFCLKLISNENSQSDFALFFFVTDNKVSTWAQKFAAKLSCCCEPSNY